MNFKQPTTTTTNTQHSLIRSVTRQKKNKEMSKPCRLLFDTFSISSFMLIKKDKRINLEI